MRAAALIPGSPRLRDALAALMLLLAALLAAAPVHAATTVTDDRGRRITLPAPPQRIVSLLPSLTEAVCALGACDRLVGVDRYSNWPAAALAAVPRVGGLEDTQIERVVALRPDVVLAAQSARATDRLEALGVRVVVLEPRTLTETRRVLQQVAVLLGDAVAGDALWQRTEARIAAAAARVPAPLRGQRIYVEVSDGPYAASGASFIGEVLARLGLVNIVPAALGPFPKLNPEFVVRAQPQIVMASTRSAAQLARRPGWEQLPALQARQVCAFDETRGDVLVRAGPRLGDAAEAIADCLASFASR